MESVLVHVRLNICAANAVLVVVVVVVWDVLVPLLLMIVGGAHVPEQYKNENTKIQSSLTLLLHQLLS